MWAYLQLMRPANIVTAWADILAGFAVSGFFLYQNKNQTIGVMSEQLIFGNLLLLVWLLLSTTGLYGGGVVLNDVFDAKIDAQERPERPIPSGRASRLGAALFASLLLGAGVVAALQVSWYSGILACAIAFAAVTYDAFGKHHPVFGPLNMGICRGGNLLLGVSVVPSMVAENWFLALIPIIYIAAVTSISRGEVNGGNRSTGTISLLLMVMVVAVLFGMGFLKNYEILLNYQVLRASPFIVLFATSVLRPVAAAVFLPSPEKIRVAVRTGVLSITVLNATLAAGFANSTYGLLVLSLLPVSMLLAQIFAVT